MEDRLLDFLRSYMAAHGFAPTYREMGEALGCSTQTVYRYLKILQKRGVVDWQAGRARTLLVRHRATLKQF